jgi:superfamily II DNA/RNA helicase
LSSSEKQSPNKKVKKVVIEATKVATTKTTGENGEEVDEQFLNDRIEVEGDVDVVPITSFTHPVINKDIAPVFANFTAPTPVQQYTWPILFGKRDVIGLAKTGSGKTLAFGVPCALALVKQKTPSMLVLAPTRELAIQIHTVMVDLAKRLKMKAAVCYGGAARALQEINLRGAHIVVATPGRLMDFMENQAIDVSKVTHFVLDEADLMLDMGFEPDVTFIESHLPPSTERQTAMFSATWPAEIQDLAARFLNNPIKISAGEASEVPVANKSITQHVEVVPYLEKKNRIKEILEETKNGKALIFTTTKRECKQLATNLTNAGIRSLSISSDLAQRSRENVLNQFKSGKLPVLVATDVASRGLDIPHVDVVINFSFPQTVESYVHRIGRTGRAGLKGVAYTLLSPGESFPVGKFINILKQADQEVPKELFNWKSMGRVNRGRSNRDGPLRHRQHKQDGLLQTIEKDPKTKEAVLKFLKSMQ